MNEPETERFEAELRRLQPAPLPAELQARLEQARPQRPRRSGAWTFVRSGLGAWWGWLCWLAPAAAVGVVLSLMVIRPHRQAGSSLPAGGSEAALTADEVVIDRTLLSSFEALATLPDGEPVRLQCRAWLEAVTLRDSARGLEVQHRTPRLEIVPVAFETY